MTTECHCGHTLGWHVPDVPAGACSIWACYCDVYAILELAPCPTCGGTGTDGFDRNGSHAEDRYVEFLCSECDGVGHLAEREAAET